MLVDSEALALEVELEILAGEGLTYDKADFVRRFMGAADAHFHQLLDADSRERLGRPLREDFIEQAHAARQLICRERLGEVPGARVAIGAVRVAKAVASSSRPAFLREKLELGGLIDLFEPHIYSTELVVRGKPHPDIFLYAAERLRAAPSGCLVIEDSINGVRSGLAAGMTVWGFIGGGHCDVALGEALLDEGAHALISDWPEAAARFVEEGLT